MEICYAFGAHCTPQPQLGLLVTFQELSSHMWVVTTGPGCADLGYRTGSKLISTMPFVTSEKSAGWKLAWTCTQRCACFKNLLAKQKGRFTSVCESYFTCPGFSARAGDWVQKHILWKHHALPHSFSTYAPRSSPAHSPAPSNQI